MMRARGAPPMLLLLLANLRNMYVLYCTYRTYSMLLSREPQLYYIAVIIGAIYILLHIYRASGSLLTV